MAYVALIDLDGDIPEEFLTQALDDDADGYADPGVWDGIAAKASEDVDAFLEGRFAVPFASPPKIVKRGARVFALEKLYLRRGVKPNPWTTQADDLRATLGKIGAGELPLSVAVDRTQPSGSLVSAPARLNSDNLLI